MSTYKLPNDKIPDYLRTVVDAIQEILGDEALDFLLREYKRPLAKK